jgi:hypothetical protein
MHHNSLCSFLLPRFAAAQKLRDDPFFKLSKLHDILDEPSLMCRPNNVSQNAAIVD